MVIFEDKDTAELSKIGVNSLLDLALLLPKSYDDLSLKDSPNESDNTIEVEINSHHSKSGLLIIDAFSTTWEIDIKIVIFNAKQWHYGAFKRGKKIFIHGKCAFNFGSWQFVNPKIVTKIGEISPHYKLDLKDPSVKKLISKYITKENLLNAGLNESESEFILKIHKNDANSVSVIRNLDQNEDDKKTLALIEILNYMKKLKSKKLDFPCRIYEIFDIKEWLEGLPFTPTNDQLRAIEDIRGDLTSKIASRRVIMGDVGSGKTLIMLSAALMNYPRISYIMAPTSILSEQIYTEAMKLLPAFMKVINVKSGEKELNLDGIHLAIGTHALLYHELKRSNLVMVDEQHRFGSNQREKINELTKDGEFRANFLQFSATPIPRTLSLIQSEYVNFSFLKEMPYQKDIKTLIIQSSGFGELLAHIKSEIAKNHQAIIVYPLVEESENSHYQSLEEASPFWLKNFQNVYITHGSDREKEQKLSEFNQKGDILITTTVVEVGISLPRLSIIVIVGAERLGLASLHQLRGRVGRNGGEGWCYLFSKLKEIPTRLHKFAATLDGFKVAQIDLKNREAGDLLDGSVQHGATFNYYDYDENLAKIAKERVKKLDIKANSNMSF